MALFDLFGKKNVGGGSPYTLECMLHPLRLPSHTLDSADLEISLRNDLDQEALTSVILSVPHALALDESGLSHERELRLGVLKPGEQKRFKVRVYSNQRSAPGQYAVKVYAAAHYRDYGHLLNEVRHVIHLRVV